MADDEPFEIFDDAGNRLGVAPRGEVHRRGWWHRAAHVWLFRADGRVLLQRRAPDKDIAPNRWDFSVGEHLRPGETFLDGARRGLEEELGVAGVALEPLGPPRRFAHADPRLGILDREETVSFRGSLEGDVELAKADGEVAETRWIDPAALERWLAAAPGDFTPWFAPDAITAGLLSARAGR